jgi:hypothetical protein
MRKYKKLMITLIAIEFAALQGMEQTLTPEETEKLAICHFLHQKNIPVPFEFAELSLSEMRKYLPKEIDSKSLDQYKDLENEFVLIDNTYTTEATSDSQKSSVWNLAYWFRHRK